MVAKDPTGQDDSGSEGRSWMKIAGPFLTMGMQLAISVVVFFFLGRWLDGVFETSPWLTIVGLVVGVAGGFVSFIKKALDLGRREDQETQERRKKEEHGES